MSGPVSEPQSARIELQGGPVHLVMEIKTTPRGLLAIGALVSGILLSSAALVWAATGVPRRHPIAAALLKR